MKTEMTTFRLDGEEVEVGVVERKKTSEYMTVEERERELRMMVKKLNKLSGKARWTTSKRCSDRA